MRRADRLFQIVQYLRGGRLLRASDLAERLEVSERTIYRDIADLIGSGVPIEGEAGVGYLMRSGYDLPPLMFTHDELVALVSGARMVRAFGGAKMAQGAEEALVKIDAILSDSARSQAQAVGIHAIQTGPLDPQIRARIDQLELTVEQKRRLKLDYGDSEGTTTTRTVRPLGLWFWGKVWTLVAWCELREDFRMFRIDRITSIQELDRFRPAPSQSLAMFFADQAYSGPGGSPRNPK